MSNASLEDFMMTIRAVANGEKVLPDPLTDSLFSQIIENALKAGKMTLFKESVKMTMREQEIIALIGKGMSNKEIALKLKISPGAVQRHIDSILKKLAVWKTLQTISL